MALLGYSKRRLLCFRGISLIGLIYREKLGRETMTNPWMVLDKRFRLDGYHAFAAQQA
jgi:hypothetical protein